MVGSGASSIDDISRVTSQAQLLDIFWSARVTGSADAVQREALLGKMVEVMLGDRALTARVDRIYEPSLASAMSELLSDGVLSLDPTSPAFIQFSHNILFDDTVSRYIPTQLTGLVQFLVADRSRVFFLRPSLLFYYSRAWRSDSGRFWALFWELLQSEDPSVRLASRLIPISILLTESLDGNELLPIAEAVRNGRSGATIAVRLLLRAIGATGTQGDPRWLPLIDALVETPGSGLAPDLVLTCGDALEALGSSASGRHMSTAGKVARSAVGIALTASGSAWHEWQQQIASNFGVPLLVRTFETAPDETRAIISQLLQFVRTEPQFPVQYFYRLCDHVPHVWIVDSDLAAQIFLTAFAHEETSDEATNLGGYVLRLTSTRRQDYQLALYVLARHFPQFLESHPLPALRAVIGVLNEHATSHHILPNLREGVSVASRVQEFSFRGASARYLGDLSYIWDATEYPDRPTEMATAALAFVTRLAAEDRWALLDQALDLWRDEALAAFWWRRLLRTASEHPASFADPLYELALATPLLTGSEVIRELASFIGSCTPHWTPEQLLSVESAILGLGVPPHQGDRKRLLAFRDRLLAQIPSVRLQTTEGRALRLRQESEGKLPNNEPLFQVTSTSGTYTREDWLKDEGAEPGREVNRDLLDRAAALDAFAGRWMNRAPDEDEISGLDTDARALLSALDGPTSADPAVVTSAWSSLAAWARAVATASPLIPLVTFALARQVLLAAASHPSPIPDPTSDAAYDSPIWYPAPRFEAAQGLPRLILQAPDQELLDSLDHLCGDPVPGVRFLVATSLFPLAAAQAEEFWRCMESMAAAEPNSVVLGGLCTTLGNALRVDRDRTLALLRRVIERGLNDAPVAPSHEAIAIVAELATAGQDGWIAELFDTLLSDPARYVDPLQQWTFAQLRYVGVEFLSSPRLDRALKTGISIIRAITHQFREQVELATSSLDTVRHLVGIADTFAERIYYGSGLFQRARSRTEGPERLMLPDGLILYYHRVRPLIGEIIALGELEPPLLPAQTAHHLMQFLRPLARDAPSEVLELAARLAQAARGGGYGLDSLAKSEVVAMVEEILVDRRSALASAAGIAHVEALLNVFAEAGWPEAIMLVWRLDEVFR
jgi:hypothetical protein